MLTSVFFVLNNRMYTSVTFELRYEQEYLIPTHRWHWSYKYYLRCLNTLSFQSKCVKFVNTITKRVKQCWFWVSLRDTQWDLDCMFAWKVNCFQFKICPTIHGSQNAVTDGFRFFKAFLVISAILKKKKQPFLIKLDLILIIEKKYYNCLCRFFSFNFSHSL